MGVLSGVRILAVEQYGAGPFGTQALADLGAEVVKIENPKDGGDVSRSLGPFFENDLGDTAQSLFYQSINRNKKSVALDLTMPEGRAVFHDLVRGADAVACNLRGDVPDRLGLTYATLGAVNPKIACCHLTAYGRGGSRDKWPGYDYLIQAETGYFHLNGEPDSPPSRFGLSIVDFMTGYCLALATVSAVLEARQTGRGRDIDVSLFDVGLANLSYLAAWNLNRDYAPERVARSGHPSLVPCQLFPTADGWIFIMANKEKFFPALCDRLGCPELAFDPRFRSFADRLANRPALVEALDPLFRARSTAEWLERLAGAVPAGPVATMDAALHSAFVTERDMVVEIEADAGGKIRVVGSPFRTSEPAPLRAAPTLGCNTDEMLATAGYSRERITALRQQGIVA